MELDRFTGNKLAKDPFLVRAEQMLRSLKQKGYPKVKGKGALIAKIDFAYNFVQTHKVEPSLIMLLYNELFNEFSYINNLATIKREK